MNHKISKLHHGVIIGLLVFISIIGSSYSLYSNALDAVEDDIHDYLSGIARVASKQLDGDIHTSFTSPDQEQSPEYKSEIAKLAEIKKDFGNIEFIYTCIIKGDDVYFILDPTPPGEKTPDGIEKKSHIMDKYDEAKNIPELMKALKTHSIGIISKPYKDRWGSFVSGYAPLFNSKDEFIGVIGVDIDASEYAEKIDRITISEIICVVIGFFTSCLIGFIVWAQTRNLNQKNLNLANYSAQLEKVNSQLIDATKVAERATLSKTSFLANMSHEIRTPMNGVMGVASLLLDTSLKPEQKELVEIIRKSGDSLLEIVNDILDVSKIEAGELSLESINFSLRDTVYDIINLLTIKANEQGVDLRVEFVGDVPEFYFGDSGRVRQIIINLMGNSVKFTNKGYVLLKIRHEDIEGKSAKLFFEVEDNGIGIPEDKLDYIFNKFTQAEESTTRKFGGTGLGLAICKNLTHMMNGNIGVKSKLGEGSTFYFDITLPYGQPVEKTNIAKESGTLVMFPNLRVLIVDDMKLNMMLVARILNKHGCKTQTAENGKEALEAVKNNEFDIIFMDCHMPIMDGYEATTAIREFENEQSRRHTPIIAITADAMKSNQRRCFASGMDDFLNKPIQEEQIEAMLLKWTGVEEKSLHGKKILVVEDSKVNQMIIIAVLEGFGCEVDLAEDGLEAVSKAYKKKYNAILMDYNLPKLSGPEAIAEIRQNNAKNSKTPIIAMTATGSGNFSNEFIHNLPVNDYINKPIEKDQVGNVLRKWA